MKGIISSKCDWEIDRRTGHCAHPLGITAYFSPEPTGSGAIRCLGPFPTNTIPDSEVRTALIGLCKTLERSEGNSDRYVVFGAYEEDPQFLEHKFTILGSSCGYIPCLGLRSQIMENETSWHKEWKEIGCSYAIHRSGLVFGMEALFDPDIGVVHPTTLSTDLATLKLAARRKGADVSARQKHLKIPLVWTPMTAVS